MFFLLMNVRKKQQPDFQKEDDGLQSGNREEIMIRFKFIKFINNITVENEDENKDEDVGEDEDENKDEDEDEDVGEDEDENKDEDQDEDEDENEDEDEEENEEVGFG